MHTDQNMEQQMANSAYPPLCLWIWCHASCRDNPMSVCKIVILGIFFIECQSFEFDSEIKSRMLNWRLKPLWLVKIDVTQTQLCNHNDYCLFFSPDSVYYQFQVTHLCCLVQTFRLFSLIHTKMTGVKPVIWSWSEPWSDQKRWAWSRSNWTMGVLHVLCQSIFWKVQTFVPMTKTENQWSKL